MSTNHDLIFLDELAKELGLTRTWLRREAQRGTIPSIRAGKRLLFSVAAVRAALAAQAAKGVKHGQ